MIALAKEKGLANCTLYNVRAYPRCKIAPHVRSGEFGEIRVVQGTYSQDWLLYDTDWNWRIESEPSRTFADIGTHWCDLAEHITALRFTSSAPNSRPFTQNARSPSTRWRRSRARHCSRASTKRGYRQDGRLRRDDFWPGRDSQGALTVSQVSVGRKNRLFIEVFGSKASAAWDMERPDELWIGHRNSPNEIIIKDPTLLREGAQSYADCRAAQRRLRRHLQASLSAAFYRTVVDRKAPIGILPSRMAFANCAFSTRFSRARRREHG